MLMVYSKHSKKDIIHPKRVVLVSLAWLAVWAVIIVGFDSASLLVNFFVDAGESDSSARNLANITARLPFILGSFALAYGIGAVANDKWATPIITLVLGILFSYASVLALGFSYFMFNYT